MSDDEVTLERLKQTKDEQAARIEKLQSALGRLAAMVWGEFEYEKFASWTEALPIVTDALDCGAEVVDHDKRINCPRCDGLGSYSFPEASSTDRSDGWYECDLCNGSGYITVTGSDKCE